MYNPAGFDPQGLDMNADLVIHVVKRSYPVAMPRRTGCQRPYAEANMKAAENQPHECCVAGARQRLRLVISGVNKEFIMFNPASPGLFVPFSGNYGNDEGGSELDFLQVLHDRFLKEGLL